MGSGFVKREFWRDTRGDAVVEATFLFPVIIMVFAGLVLLAMYLPTRAALQRATQYAATAIATERSDTWLRYDTDEMKYVWVTDKSELGGVYGSLLRAIGGNSRDDGENARTIVTTLDERGVLNTPGELTVEYGVVNYVIYKEIVVTATRTVPIPVDLSFVRFPREIPITVTSTAVVQNGDEFVRNMDLAADIITFIADETGISGVFQKAGEVCGKFNDLLGI